MKTKLLPLLVALTFAFSAQAQSQGAMPGEGVTVNPGIATWQSARPIEAVMESLLEQLGYTVADPTSLSNPIFYQSITQGDVDYWANGWFPLHNQQLPANFEENASLVGTIVERGALGGYLIDNASQQEYDITSLEDFKRDEVKEAFDVNGDGKADLVGCPPGWGCEQVISHHVEAYGLADHVNVITAAYAASFSDALARYNNDQPVLYYTWTPNFTVFRLRPGEDVTWINVPAINPSDAQQGLEDAMTVSGVTGAVSDPLDMGFVANNINVVANNAFLESNPAARALFEQVKIPLADISEMTARINEGEDSAEEVVAMAEEWISGHQEEVDGWLEQARAAAQ